MLALVDFLYTGQHFFLLHKFIIIIIIIIIIIAVIIIASLSPSCRVVIHIFPRQTMSLGDTLLQLFCLCCLWCLYV